MAIPGTITSTFYWENSFEAWEIAGFRFIEDAVAAPAATISPVIPAVT